MARLKRDDGFTMVEMLIVLLLLGFGCTLFPLFQTKKESVLRLEMETLRKELLQIQTTAIHEKRSIDVRLAGGWLSSEEGTREFSMECRATLSFNASGNINHAMSIPCSLGTKKASLVILLGSGRMYVKE